MKINPIFFECVLIWKQSQVDQQFHMSIIEFTLKKDDVSSDTPAHWGVASKDTEIVCGSGRILHTN